MSPYGTTRGKHFIKDQTHILPVHSMLKNKTSVVLSTITTQEQKHAIWQLLNQVLDQGNAYPQYGPMDYNDFEDYYLSHNAYILSTADGEVVGSVYIKPNFPGRSSHICNGGFLISPLFRNLGACTILAKQFEILAKDLGYSAIFFNLVFSTNLISIRIWENLGYRKIGIIPKAANLKDFGYTDALQYYKDLTL